LENDSGDLDWLAIDPSGSSTIPFHMPTAQDEQEYNMMPAGRMGMTAALAAGRRPSKYSCTPAREFRSKYR
jgi:hypothetical protein